MKICIVTPRYPPNIVGGGEVSCHLLAKELSEDHRVEVVTFDGNVTSQSSVEGVKVIRNKPFSPEKTTLNLQCFGFLRKKVKEYDIFHTYNMDFMPAVGLLTKLHHIKSVATLNGTVFSRRAEWYDDYLNCPLDLRAQIIGTFLLTRNMTAMKAIKNIQLFTTLCPFSKEVFVQEGVPKEKIRVIPNMLDTKFKVERKPSKNQNLIYLGSFRPRKGLDTLIEAYSFLKKQNIELLLVGNGNKNQIKNLVEHKKLGNAVRFLGKVPYERISYLYAEAYIFVQPNRYPEPVGRTLIEAMQAGLCVVATGNNSYSPIIRDMIDGVLIYPCTSRKLAEKIQLLIDNPNLGMELSKNAQKRVDEVCHPRKIIKKYIEIYEELS